MTHASNTKSVNHDIDISKCPHCGGSGMYYPNGYDKGVAKCKHEQLITDPKTSTINRFRTALVYGFICGSHKTTVIIYLTQDVSRQLNDT